MGNSDDIGIYSRRHGDRSVGVSNFSPRRRSIDIKCTFYLGSAFCKMKFPAVIKAEADRLFLNVFPFGNVCQGMVESLQDHAFAGMQLEAYLGFAFLLAGLCFPFFSRHRIEQHDTFCGNG